METLSSKKYTYVALRQKPELKEETAAWFHDKWEVPQEAYLECMEAYLNYETEYRCQGIAGQLLDIVLKDMKSKGITPIYLITDHTSFYERYGWEFLCMVQGDNEPNMTRMYIHR